MTPTPDINKEKDKFSRVLIHPHNSHIHFRGISTYIFLMLQKWNYFSPEMKEMVNIYYEKIKEQEK
jgi:hypothetical protein